jgi:hypothetical protein
MVPIKDSLNRLVAYGGGRELQSSPPRLDRNGEAEHSPSMLEKVVVVPILMLNVGCVAPTS